MLARHIEARDRPQIYDLIEFWVEVGVGLGLVLALFDFFPRHTARPGADDQALRTINYIVEWHRFSVESLFWLRWVDEKGPFATRLECAENRNYCCKNTTASNEWRLGNPIQG
jgi:hypothetical protein